MTTRADLIGEGKDCRRWESGSDNVHEIVTPLPRCQNYGALFGFTSLKYSARLEEGASTVQPLIVMQNLTPGGRYVLNECINSSWLLCLIARQEKESQGHCNIACVS